LGHGFTQIFTDKGKDKSLALAGGTEAAEIIKDNSGSATLRRARTKAWLSQGAQRPQR